MDAKRLKKDFGKDFFSWGAIDTEKILPFKPPGEVKEEMKRRIDDLAPVHNIQTNVPSGNIMAVWRRLRNMGNIS